MSAHVPWALLAFCFAVMALICLDGAIRMRRRVSAVFWGFCFCAQLIFLGYHLARLFA